MAKLTIDRLDVNGKRVLVRVDFNVPQDENSAITDDTRIRATLPTIKYILDNGGSAILMSHLGRPKSGPDPRFSLAPVAKRLSQLLNHDVLTLPDCVGPVVETACREARPGMVILLENLRFHPEEEAGDPAFARQLAALGDLYVNDAFGTAHRAHASTAVIAQFCPQAAAGFLMAKEINFLGRVVSNPERPYAVVLGGAKVSSKLKVIENLLPKADKIIIGGGMAYTFLAAQGHDMGQSLVESELIPTAKSILEKDTTGKIVLRIDHICADRFAADATPVLVSTVDIPPTLMGMDIGLATVELFSKHLRDARMVFWNGPMGVFEFPNFAAGTRAIGEVIAKAPTSIVGGGDTIQRGESAWAWGPLYACVNWWRGIAGIRGGVGIARHQGTDQCLMAWRQIIARCEYFAYNHTLGGNMKLVKMLTIVLVMLTLAISCQKNPIQEQIEITNDHACWLSNATQLYLYDLNGNILMSYSDLDYISDLAVNPHTRDLWAAKPAVGQLVKYSAAGNLVKTVNGFVLPISLSINYDTGDIWVADSDLGQVVVLDQLGNEITRIVGFQDPTSVSICSANGAAWVADPGVGEVYHLIPPYYYVNPVRLPGNQNVNLVAGNQVDGSCWAYSEDETGSGMLTKLNANGIEVLSVTGVKSPRSMEISYISDDSTLWVADSGNNRVLKLDSNGNILVNLYDFFNPSDVSVDQSDGSCWAAIMGINQLVYLDATGSVLLSTESITSPLQVAAMPVINP